MSAQHPVYFIGAYQKNILWTDHRLRAGIWLLRLHIEVRWQGDGGHGGPQGGHGGHGGPQEVRPHRPHRLLHVLPLRQDALQDRVQGAVAVLGDHGDQVGDGGEGGTLLTRRPGCPAGQLFRCWHPLDVTCHAGQEEKESQYENVNAI